MSFVGVATAIGLEGIAANIAAGAMMGGSVKVGTNVLTGQKPFKDIGQGIVMGGLTGGIAPSVSSAFDLSMPTAMGITQGGLTLAATGDINKALMSGMTAYGAAGLAEGFGGGNAQGEQVFGDVQAAEGSLGDKFNKYLTGPDAGAKPFTAPGVGSGNFLKDNFKYMGALAGPILAEQAIKDNMPKTTTAPSTAAYRPYTYDPYSGTYESLGIYPINPPQKAAEGGLMGTANDSMFNYAHGGEPVVRMANGGGILALAGGGDLVMPEGWGTAGGAYDTPEEKIAYFNKYNITPDQLLGSNQGVTQADIDWMSQQGYAGNTIAPGSNKYIENVKNFFTSNPNATYQDIQAAAQGLNQKDVLDAMKQAGLSGAAQFAAYNPNIGSEANTAETYGGLKGLSNNINYWLAQHPGASAQDIRREMANYDLSEADFIRATGTDVNNYAMGPITKVQQPAEGLGGNTTAVVNENGTVTQVAVPETVTGGQPIGTVQQVKDVYTQGGGSTGYTVNAPKTMAEFDTRFNKLTGGSKQAYDYLMGKAPYSATPYTETGEIMKPYWESVAGLPKNLSARKYIFDPTTRTYKANPDYQPVSYDDTTRKKVKGMSSNQIKAGLQALPNPTDDAATYRWMVENKLTPAQVAAALGTPLSEIQAKYNRYAGTTGGTTGTTGGTGNTSTIPNSTNPLEKPTNSPGADKVWSWDSGSNEWVAIDLPAMAAGGLSALAAGGMSHLGSYSDGGRLLRGPGDGVSDSIPAVIGKKQPARLADGEFVVPARIVSELGNGSTEAGARKLYAMMDRVQAARRRSIGKGKVAKNSRADKYLPA